MEKGQSRRGFLRMFALAAPLIAGGSMLLGSCGSGEKGGSGEGGKVAEEGTAGGGGSAVTNCGDLTGVAPAELEKRKSLAYVEKTPIADSHCANCQLYIPAEEGQSCGGCMLFKGPVFEEGYCTYWAPKV